MARILRRSLVMAPFGIAGVLNTIMVVRDRLHLPTEHFAGYGFLFAAPWFWLVDLLDYDSFFGMHLSKSAEQVLMYAIILWLPASLYALSFGAMWILILRTVRIIKIHTSEIDGSVQ